MATLSNVYLVFYLGLKIKSLLIAALAWTVANGGIIELSLCFMSHCHIEIKCLIIFIRILVTYIFILAKVTFKQLLNKMLHHGATAPCSTPNNKPKDGWWEKLKKFYREHDVEIKLVSVIVGSGIVLYLFNKFYQGGGGDDPASRFDDPDTSPPPVLPEQTRFALHLGKMGTIKRTKQDALSEVAAPLIQHFNCPGWEDYTAYIVFIAKICEFAPADNYVINHLERVLSSIPNSSSRSTFKRLSHCLEDPTYASEEAMSRVYGKISYFIEHADDQPLNLYLNVLLSIVSVIDGDLGVLAINTLLEKADFKPLEDLLIQALNQLRDHQVNGVATGESINKLASVLRQAEPLCKNF